MKNNEGYFFVLLNLIPQIVDDLYTKRVEVKKLLDPLKREYSKNQSKKTKKQIDQLDIKQYTIKILINSIYGYFGNKMAPFGDDDIASSITLTGQAVIKQSNKIITEYVQLQTGNPDDNPIIYNDTDSSYVSLESLMNSTGKPFSENGVVTLAAYEQAEALEKYLNERILIWGTRALNSSDCRFVFKRECMGDVGIFLQKKRYVLHVLDDEGIACNKFKYTGVEVVRSTLPKTIKPMVKKVIETMMMTESFSETNKCFREAYDTFKSLPIEDIAVVMGIREYDKYANKCNGYQVCKGMPIHVKAAYFYNMLLEKEMLTNQFETISNGDKVRYYYVNVPNRLGITSLAYKQYVPDSFKNDFPPDMQMMFDKIVYSIIDRFYTTVNWTLSRPNKQVQTDLFALLG